NTPAATNGYRRKAMGTFAYTSTTLSAATAVGATNIKVASVTGLATGGSITVDPQGANPETVTITTVGTTGAGGTGVSFTPALAFAHASGAQVTTGSVALNGTPANTTSAVVFYSDAYDDTAIQVEFLRPGAANSPLSIATVGKKITVNLASNGSGGLSSTA